MLLGCLIGIVVAATCSFIDFRIGAVVLAAVPAGLAVLRAMPQPWCDFWVNRSRGADIATTLIFAGLIVLLALAVPQSR